MKLKYVGLFILSFLVGIAFVLLSPVEYKTVVIYPTPTNLKQIYYKDSSNACFQFTSKLVDCKPDAKVQKIQ